MVPDELERDATNEEIFVYYWDGRAFRTLGKDLELAGSPDTLSRPPSASFSRFYEAVRRVWNSGQSE